MSSSSPCSSFVPFRFLFQTFAIIASAQAFCSTPASADLIFSGDFQAGTGTLEITNSITFTITGETSGTGGILIVLDNIVTADGERTPALADSNFAFSVNGNPVTASDSSLNDNWVGAPINEVTAGDGLLDCKLGSVLTNDDRLTLLAGNYSFAAINAFNPLYNDLTFTGDIFIADSRNGNQISSIESAVPEPGSLALVGIASIGILARRRRSMFRLRPSKGLQRSTQ